MRTLENACGFELSEQAKFRFHVLNLLYKTDWKAVHVAFPSLSRATVYRWKKAYESSRKKLNALLPKSTRPHHIRLMQTPIPILRFIKAMRQHYPRMGKAKLKLFLDAFCKQNNLSTVSQTTIGKIIKRNHFFFAGKPCSRRTSAPYGPRNRIRLCPKSKDTHPGYVQLDGFKLFLEDRYYHFLTAVDIVTRQAWVKLVPGFSSKPAAAFLEHVRATAWKPVHTVQTDNGPEFLLFFEEAAKRAQLKHLFSYPRHSKTNGFVERFNWTVQDEFLSSYEDLLLYPDDFKQELLRWTAYYNEVRPHQSLGYLSPRTHLIQKEAAVSNVCD